MQKNCKTLHIEFDVQGSPHRYNINTDDDINNNNHDNNDDIEFVFLPRLPLNLSHLKPQI